MINSLSATSISPDLGLNRIGVLATPEGWTDCGGSAPFRQPERPARPLALRLFVEETVDYSNKIRLSLTGCRKTAAKDAMIKSTRIALLNTS
ncbi:MAG: hypothetical protein M0T86_07915 [Betaproteobacteria bacterium]|nr:hypothetical protein [Betaproteobacteria bacterium]